MTKPSPEDMAAQEDLAAQIAHLRADMARIAETLAALGQARAETLRGDAMASAAEKLTEATEFARKNPAQAMALAGGAGLLLGLLFGRR